MSNIRHSTDGWSNVEYSKSETPFFGCRIFDIRRRPITDRKSDRIFLHTSSWYYVEKQLAQPYSDWGKSNFPTVDVQGLSSVYLGTVVDCKILAFVQGWVHNRTQHSSDCGKNYFMCLRHVNHTAERNLLLLRTALAPYWQSLLHLNCACFYYNTPLLHKIVKINMAGTSREISSAIDENHDEY